MPFEKIRFSECKCAVVLTSVDIQEMGFSDILKTGSRVCLPSKIKYESIAWKTQVEKKIWYQTGIKLAYAYTTQEFQYFCRNVHFE